MDQIHWIGVIIAIAVATWIAFRVVKAAIRVFVLVGVILFVIGLLLFNGASAMSAGLGG